MFLKQASVCHLKFILLSLLSYFVYAEDLPDSWTAGLQALNKSEWGLASRYSNELLLKYGEVGKHCARLLTIRMQERQGKYQLFEQSAQQVFPVKLAPEISWKVTLEYARLAVSVKKLYDARNLANQVGEKQGLDGMSQASEVLGDVALKLGVFSNAQNWYRKGLNYAIRAQGEYKTSEWLITQIKAKLSKMAKDEDLIVHGKGFVLYEEANRARLSGRYSDAERGFESLIKYAHEHSGPSEEHVPAVYVCAAVFYEEQSRYFQNPLNVVKNYTGIEKILDKTPYEADYYLLIGDAMYLSGQPLEQVKSIYLQGEAALNAVAQITGDKFNVPIQSVVRTTGAREMKKYSGWGSQDWFMPKSNEIYNALASPWYSDYLHYEIGMRISFCDFMMNQVEKAVNNLEIIGKYDEKDYIAGKKGQPSTYNRFKYGYNSGGLYATDFELKSFSLEQKGHILFGDLFFEMEQWNDAEFIFKYIKKKTGLNLNELAYVEFVEISLDDMRGQSKEILARCDCFLKSYSGTPSAPRVEFLRASKLSPKDAIVRYETLSNMYRGTMYQNKSLMNAAQICISLKMYKEARGFLMTLQEATTDANYLKCVSSMLSYIEPLDH